jgi:hypothetical protein
MKLKGPAGQELNGEQLQFKVKTEGFSEYELSDGNTLKIRLVVAEVYCLDTKDPLTGRPNYVIKSTSIISVIPP